ncbi:hypothetical protein [Parasedimentitalea huanghaiensis]|uniref:Oxidoreductase n=1 Tax=Parasedimentitalea huanghaiensis TaxID=2682100 RepID=A0A6L6WFX1_9RHOB|nr:hypothetical protein [Zongyanglinia huanghaiensis]MVO16733.1 hypothetical protein [Zongyanglinia huanghaiensis]
MIKTWQDIEDRGGQAWLTPAEILLIEASKSGDPCVLGDGLCPEEGNVQGSLTVRAEVLRYLVLGGCNIVQIQDLGVHLWGACITGELDLSFAKAKGALGLLNCRIDQGVQALQTRFEMLNLSGSSISLLNAQSASFHGDVFLRDTRTNGPVRLNGATIGGQLDLTGAHIHAPNRNALNGQRLRVERGFFWRNVTVSAGAVDLNSAHVGDLVDDVTGWPPKGRLILDGFTYERISGSSTRASKRIAWLEQGSEWNGYFHPQPFTHLAQVFRDLGHDTDARRVLARREQLARRYERHHMRVVPDGSLGLGFKSIWRDLKRGALFAADQLLRLTVGYGHHPFRSLWLLVALVCAAMLPAQKAWEEGSMAPNAAPVLVSQDWRHLAGTSENPARDWSAVIPGKDWETFYAPAYASDLVIPLVNLGQTDAWAPSTERGPWGWHLWWLRWLFTTAGWIVTALGAAAITGIIRRD